MKTRVLRRVSVFVRALTANAAAASFDYPERFIAKRTVTELYTLTVSMSSCVIC